MVDLRKVRFHNITSPEFSHLLWVLYWPLYGLAFALLELLQPLERCHAVWCPLDARIPFCEWFFILYLFWFVFLIGMNIYLALWEPEAFRRFMRFIALTYSFTILVYLLYPTCQNLRPESFRHDNFLTRFAAAFYAFDTNTNVCPSLHVIGSLAVCFGAWDSRRFSAPRWKAAYFITALLISISTVFVKQHSAIDVAAAFMVSALGYRFVYVPLPKRVRRVVHGKAG